MKIGILGAMLEEVSSIIKMMDITKQTTLANRIYYEGTMHGVDVVVVFSRWGKVASAITTTTLIQHFKVGFIFFTGVAGAVSHDLNIGDIVIANGLYQHDMDARPFFDQYQIPLTQTLVFKPRDADVDKTVQAIKQFIDNIHSVLDTELLEKYSISKPKLHIGLIASGDKFIANPEVHADLQFSQKDSPTLAVEMEGAAVAQVCEDYQVPYVIIRTISDKADHTAPVDFQLFIKDIASRYTYGILAHVLVHTKSHIMLDNISLGE